MIVKTWEQYRDEALAQLREHFPYAVALEPGGGLYKIACHFADRFVELQKLVIDQCLITSVDVKGEVSL